MDNFEDFFSFEALQLLANNGIFPGTASQATTLMPQGDEWAATPAPQQENQVLRNHVDAISQSRGPQHINDTSGPDLFTPMLRKRKRRKPLDSIPGCSIMGFAEAPGPKSKRSKFQPERKKEVAKIRITGACLRCKQLKISCSEIWPCPPCRRSKSSCHGRAPNFRWMDSVSCSFNVVDIYAIDSGCTPEQLAGRFLNDETIDFGDVTLDFEAEVLWDLDVMVSEFAGWMSQEHALPASTSRVGILSSANFAHLVRTIADERLTRAFRLLVESSSVLYNHNGQLDICWKNYNKDDLENIRSFAGTSVLRHLERVLSNIALAEISLKEMKALFLILFGTIIAVSYSQPAGHDEERPGFSGQSYSEAQQQLLRILAHHMVQIAERASILDQEADKILLIERANNLWDRQAIFEWEMVAFSSCNSSIVSDDESIDGEGNGSGIDSPSREDDVANLYTEIGPPITPQQPFWAQELYTCHAGHLLNPSPARCIRCKGLLMGSFCLDCMLDGDPCGTLFDASHVTGNTKDYMDSPSGPIAPKHLCTHINLSDTSLVSTEKTVQESRQGIVEGWANIPDWEAMTPGHTQLATSSSAPLDGTRYSADARTDHHHEPHDRGCLRKRKNLLV